jgi:S-adenosyl-L-methionine hydrolase (adenosine-forming)
MRVITLTTDFGQVDWFVGALKGVILSRYPRASIVDITHSIPPGDIRAGAFTLLQATRSFPPRTIHVGVVDPGVGGDREAIVIETERALHIGPDNGLFSFAVRDQVIRSVRRLANPRLFQHPISRTFHGRDMFAPVAAHLAAGFPLRQVGPPLTDFVRLDWPEPEHQADRICGQVLYLDRFGNAITNLDALTLTRFAESSGGVAICVGRHRGIQMGESYSAAGRGRPLALIGSTGLLEIAIHGGSAAVQLGLKVGATVTVCRPSGTIMTNAGVCD